MLLRHRILLPHILHHIAKHDQGHTITCTCISGQGKESGPFNGQHAFQMDITKGHPSFGLQKVVFSQTSISISTHMSRLPAVFAPDSTPISVMQMVDTGNTGLIDQQCNLSKPPFSSSFQCSLPDPFEINLSCTLMRRWVHSLAEMLRLKQLMVPAMPSTIQKPSKFAEPKPSFQTRKVNC